MPTRRSLLATLPALAAGCSTPSQDGGDTSVTGTTTPTGQTMPAMATPPAQSQYWYTHPQASGNRTLAGAGALRGSEPITFEVEGFPQWLVAHPAQTGSHWTVVTKDGRATRWRVADSEAIQVDEYDPLPEETQPVVTTDRESTGLVSPPADMASKASPVVEPGSDDEASKLVYVAENGDLVIAGASSSRLAIDGLSDGRPAAVGDGRYAVFGDTTDRYGHGALGDSIEPATLYVVDAAAAEITAEASVGPPEVFEGLQPLVADVDGDGDPEIVTTVADSDNGARIAVFDTAGNRLATGTVYGPGWRHQLAVAPFGPDGTPEIAVVRKPHVDHTLEFYRLEDGSLPIVATAPAFSSHTYGSRILDGAVAADLDADGNVEALVPTTQRDALAAVKRSGEGASVAWQWSLDGVVRTNVTGVALEDGLAVGTATSGAVYVWQR
jgi:hypothetical protein